jgi:hypothetical protein
MIRQQLAAWLCATIHSQVNCGSFAGGFASTVTSNGFCRFVAIGEKHVFVDKIVFFRHLGLRRFG